LGFWEDAEEEGEGEEGVVEAGRRGGGGGGGEGV